MLEKPNARKVFRKMEHGTAPMIVHRDVDSFFSAPTTASVNSSKRSLRFDFDQQLFLSRIYERWIRGSVKFSLWK